MAGMGKVPKPGARHRGNDTLSTALVKLPAQGRTGETPSWPLPDGSPAELDLWAQLWRTPQAVAWEDLGWTRSVARYVRTVLEAEERSARATLLAEVRQMEDRLGLSPMSMLRLRWAVTDDEAAAPDEEFTIPDEWFDAHA